LINNNAPNKKAKKRVNSSLKIVKANPVSVMANQALSNKCYRVSFFKNILPLQSLSIDQKREFEILFLSSRQERAIG
jgi:hypothetical protein